MMKSVVVDKIASVTQACGLAHELRMPQEIPSEKALCLVVEVLTNKSTYNTLELTSGRMAKVSKAMSSSAHRPSQGAVRLFGPLYPTKSRPATSFNSSTSDGGSASATRSIPTRQPFDCRVSRRRADVSYLGERIGRAGESRLQGARLRRELNTRGVPSSRSPAPAWKRQDRSGLLDRQPHAPPRPRGRCFKATGVSLRRDILAMEDSGARRT